jgi:SAM-dependent methyltransferase
MNKRYVHYGCGLTAPLEWENYDISPTLRLQKLPVLGRLIQNRLNVVFPPNVKYGNIIRGLPVQPGSCDGVYCSHTLEHLALQDFRAALTNTFKILKPGGIFRCVVPDLETYTRSYLSELEQGKDDASIRFLNTALLGYQSRRRGLSGLIVNYYGNSNHLWMWDHLSLSKELSDAGFEQIRRCRFNDCEDTMFKKVEDAGRFQNAVAIECRKVKRSR